MAPKPASTAGKAPASSATASKAPAKTTEGSKAAKKTSKTAAAPGEEGKKKRRKVRKETYSSYIYKGTWWLQLGSFDANTSRLKCWSRCTLILVSPTRRWPSLTRAFISWYFICLCCWIRTLDSWTTSLSVSPPRHPVCLLHSSYNFPSRSNRNLFQNSLHTPRSLPFRHAKSKLLYGSFFQESYQSMPSLRVQSLWRRCVQHRFISSIFVLSVCFFISFRVQALSRCALLCFHLIRLCILSCIVWCDSPLGCTGCSLFGIPIPYFVAFIKNWWHPQ